MPSQVFEGVSFLESSVLLYVHLLYLFQLLVSQKASKTFDN